MSKKGPAPHPSYEVMIYKAIKEHGRYGASIEDIKTYIESNYKVDKTRVSSEVATNIKKLFRGGDLTLSMGNYKVSPKFANRLTKAANAARAATKPKVVKKVAHPSYKVMVNKAISVTKSRGGASRMAIFKYLQANYKVPADVVFKRMLSVQLKRLVKNGDLTMVKASYKISDKAKQELKKSIRKKASIRKKSVKKVKGKKKSTKKAKKTGPKRPKSAYLFWSADHRAEIKKKHPDVTPQQLIGLIAAEWKKTSANDRKKFDTLAAKDKTRYQTELAATK